MSFLLGLIIIGMIEFNEFKTLNIFSLCKDLVFVLMIQVDFVKALPYEIFLPINFFFGKILF